MTSLGAFWAANTLTQIAVLFAISSSAPGRKFKACSGRDGEGVELLGNGIMSLVLFIGYSLSSY